MDRRLPYSEFIGYGNELLGALTGGQADAALGAFQAWALNAPHQDHICFIDVTYLTPSVLHFVGANDLALVDSALASASTMVLTPRHGVDGLAMSQAYLRTLKDEFIGRGLTMAVHPGFLAGLPRGTDHENTFYFGDLGKSDSAPLANTEIPDGPTFVGASFPTYDSTSGQAARLEFARRTIAADVDTLWTEWETLWSTKQTQQVSGIGLPLRWLMALPLGLRDADRPETFVPYATVFLGVDGAVAATQVLNIARYVALQVYDANLNAYSARVALIEQHNATTHAGGHEVRKVLRAIGPGLDNETAAFIRKYLELAFVTSSSELDSDNQQQRVEYLSSTDTNAKLREAFLLAANLEALVYASGKRGRREEHAREFVHLCDALLTLRKIDQPSGPIATSIADDQVKMGLTALFHNAIKHSNPKTHASKFELQMTEERGVLCVQLTNTVSRRSATAFRSATPDGTLGVVRHYIEAAGLNGEMVEIRKVDVKKSEGQVTETWLSQAPIAR